MFGVHVLELKSHVKSPETIWQNSDKIENQELLKHLPGLCMELELGSCGRVTAAGCVPAVPGMDLGGRGRRGEDREEEGLTAAHI